MIFRKPFSIHEKEHENLRKHSTECPGNPAPRAPGNLRSEGEGAGEPEIRGTGRRGTSDSEEYSPTAP